MVDNTTHLASVGLAQARPNYTNTKKIFIPILNIMLLVLAKTKFLPCTNTKLKTIIKTKVNCCTKTTPILYLKKPTEMHW